MGNQPLVSVIMPCFNHGKYIQAAVASVLNQPYKNVEIIIVDDGSTDEFTHEVLRLLEKDAHVIRQLNQGPSVARNNAIAAAKGEYLLALDSDNKIREDYITKAVEVLQMYQEVGVVYGNFKHYGEDDTVREQLQFNIRQQLLYNLIDMCTVFRKSIFTQVGGFDEFMSKRGLEDWDFWILVHRKGWRFYHLGEVMFDYYVSSKSRTFEVANKNLDELKQHVWRKHADLLAQEYELMYHEIKDIKKSRNYKLGSMLLAPIRMLKQLVG